ACKPRPPTSPEEPTGMLAVRARMRRWPRLSLGVACLATSLPVTTAVLAQANDELRCGGRIVDPGVAIGYVLERCGTPRERRVREVPVRALNPNGTTR